MLVTIDIESKKIESDKACLPEPVGCSIKIDDEPSRYYAWGHPTENNCTREEFAATLNLLWDQHMVTHNGLGFDIPILQHWFNLPARDPLLTEDTLFLAYLRDPHAKSLGLKELAESWLGMPPDEQAEMNAWIMANVPECRSKKQCGAYISEVPGEMAGRYACGDTDRTHALYMDLLETRMQMQEAYDRERKLAPVLAAVQHRGMRVDRERLQADYQVAIGKKHKLDDMIRAHLKQGAEFNPGSDKELGAVLLALGYEGFLTTPTGKVSMSRPSLESVLEKDPALLSMLSSRSVYDTLTGTFMLGWLDRSGHDGHLHASYNQVRNPEGYGTRTGRLSSSAPNLQNVPNNLGTDHFGDPFPEMRSYLLPDDGHVWLCADLKNQEPRLAAHFEDGALLAAFMENPLLDPYQFVAGLCGIERKPAKTIFLGILYAMGLATMADRLGIDAPTAGYYRMTIKSQLPGLSELDYDCKRRFATGLPIRTLGGRFYYCEPPANGRDWSYKALNTLIQGSAADQMKEVLVYTAERLEKYGARILGTVHDEINVSCPVEHVEDVTALLQVAANALRCDVPMIFDADHGNCWSEAK